MYIRNYNKKQKKNKLCTKDILKIYKRKIKASEI